MWLFEWCDSRVSEHHTRDSIYIGNTPKITKYIYILLQSKGTVSLSLCVQVNLSISSHFNHCYAPPFFLYSLTYSEKTVVLFSSFDVVNIMIMVQSMWNWRVKLNYFPSFPTHSFLLTASNKSDTLQIEQEPNHHSTIRGTLAYHP